MKKGFWTRPIRETVKDRKHGPAPDTVEPIAADEGPADGEGKKDAGKKDELRPDIAAAASRMGWKLGAMREVRRLEPLLWEGEQVLGLTRGTYGDETGTLVLTDRRVLFVFIGVMRKHTEDFTYDRISSIAWHSRFAFGTVDIFASGNKIEITRVLAEQGKQFVDLAREKVSASQRGAPGVAPAASAADPIEQLRHLSALHDSGGLTDDEFTAAKARVVGRM